ncbi:prolyl-tRNA synthetase [Candidatus Nomurabacteria bacterium RIFCSPHIGHO2_01_FULL_40_12]|uniref:Proline--tRNA ligase n=1 Tax=Candidatus Nomurabacteria bacterium RIFCSPHIGHO2_01_FULL_40_12 TaxID=1801737 RepID=A0A1F6UYC9_9BACT|nr:MAG: prolyl-tRNA synthetase [Candidatus Nomurabacteria bacterium RIFCSPHIGHO2_01_FULL_40_12]
MRQSRLFTRTRKEIPADEVARNAELLIRGGFIHKELAGVYSYLPLGLRVFNKIENIIRKEMNKIGGVEVTLSALQEKSTWEPTNQWDDKKVDVWFKTKLKNETELGLAVTHEAPMTKMLKDFIRSYRDLPVAIYQFQTKFRNEIRAKSGIMRTREFVMKDLYSFNLDEKTHLEFYEKVKEAYKNIFKQVGIGHLTYLTFASGGMFSKFSHEFQTITSAGEDTIYINEENNIAINKEVFTDEVKKDLNVNDNFKEAKAVEVGNIFTLGTKFSDALNLKYQTEDGENKSVFMGSYGIGPGRVMGTIVEVLSDDKGIIWPESVAPFTVHLLTLGEEEETKAEAEKIYESLIQGNIEVLFDDRIGMSAGEKFADADLLGMPYRAVISIRSLKEGGVELKKRTEDKGKIVSLKELLKLLVS